ncbi:amidase [Urbifossiella limnaea]|uniref:Glutamyl-tRNA(Gln) amidotransferase subunit A n=1 Tax=Urbifossiella limnaea TaxID=2528023 RepID=A0A517XZI7_9BACT|nr:amidase [Urbifossiella limnaea]QDU22920.1 Glutamyl-tRNA(Gln) amidotransferase subunit A [Urbifossiella limnaea]
MTPDGPRTITAAAELIRRGDLTPSELLEQCLARIDRYEPRVKAWVVVDRDGAREQAERLTTELKAGTNRGPLHGIPVGIKDIIDVFDLPTGCGSKLWANSVARQDATCVSRLRQAGAVIVGKTVTTAFAFLDPPPTRNPWNLERTPGGSSSGSAAAVACGMCLGALGTQTGGSLTRPASFCGVYSLKPTWSRVSVNGVLPFSTTLDHVGVMANCVRDLAILIEPIAGHDPDDSSASWRPVSDCVSRIDESLKRTAEQSRDDWLPRPGYVHTASFFAETVAPEVAEFMDRIDRDLKSLAHSDAVVRRSVLPAGFADIHRHHRTIMAVEAAEVHGRRLARHPDDYPPRIRELIEEGQRVPATEFRAARLARDRLDEDMTSFHQLEPLLTPATVSAAPAADTTGSPWCNVPWSFLGVPTVSLPLGWSADGLPLAVQLVGAQWAEDSLLTRAALVEHVFRLDGAFEPRPLPLD